MKVKLKRGWSKTYPELTVGNVYRVLGIEADNLRVVDDTGRPFLFTALAFEFVDASQPASWIFEHGDGGEVYAYPPELRDPRCFFEKFHDDNADVRRKFNAYMIQLCQAESADGRATHAWGKGSTGTTQLGTVPAPPDATIASNPEFVVSEVSRTDFEAVWEDALDQELA